MKSAHSIREQLTSSLGGLDVAYDGSVLRPRPWTVAQGEWAAELASHAPQGPLLELFCGVGHIGLVAALGSGRPLVQVDADPRACAFARRNARSAGLAASVGVHCARVEQLTPSRARFALVLADPPYVPSLLVDGFPDDPVAAIDGGPDGLDPARRCVDLLAEVLDPDGWALIQLRSTAQVDQLAAHARGRLELVEVRSWGPDRHVAQFALGATTCAAPQH